MQPDPSLVRLATALGHIDAIGTILMMAEHLRFNDSSIQVWQERADEMEAHMIAEGIL